MLTTTHHGISSWTTWIWPTVLFILLTLYLMTMSWTQTRRAIHLAETSGHTPVSFRFILILISSRHKSFKWSLLFRLSEQNFLCVSYLSNLCYMSLPSNYPLFYHHHVIWLRVLTINSSLCNFLEYAATSSLSDSQHVILTLLTHLPFSGWKNKIKSIQNGYIYRMFYYYMPYFTCLFLDIKIS